MVVGVGVDVGVGVGVGPEVGVGVGVTIPPATSLIARKSEVLPVVSCFSSQIIMPPARLFAKAVFALMVGMEL